MTSFSIEAQHFVVLWQVSVSSVNASRWILNTEHVVGFGTYIDDNLCAAEGQVRTREMFSDLGGVHAIVISDPRDIQQSAVRLPATVHGRRTELLDIQLGAVTYPLYATGITDKNFELVELKKKYLILLSELYTERREVEEV
jgi:hypothetical protein